MGHTHHRYDEFDESLTRPLYGYVTEFKSGEVPSWVRPPREHNERKVARLLGIEHDDHTEPIPKSELPAGVTRQNAHRSKPTSYKFAPETYLEAHREQSSNDDLHTRVVNFDLDRGRGYRRSRGRTVPSEIEDRIDAITETSRWRRKVDGYHVSASGWKLCYTLGNRGGIQDVHIVADLNH